jgi:hypothetical protein
VRIFAKKQIRKLRDSVFEGIEIQVLKYLYLLPRYKRGQQRLITITHRAGRGLKESQAHNEFFATIPKSYRSNFKHFHYNSQIWILDFFKVLYYFLMYPNMKIIVIQYVPKFLKFPSVALLNFLHERGVKIIKIWPDSWSRDLWQKRILPVSHIGNLSIVCDIPNNPLVELDKSNLYLWHPAPIADFPYVNFKERQSFVFYSGGVSQEGLYKSRREYLEYLNSNGYAVAGVSYDRDRALDRPSYKDYRQALANSKIGLNFTWKDDVDIITGRTWEVLSSGTLLLQNDSMILDGLFEEGVHYIAFSSKEDLLARLSFLVENPTYAETIANSGYQRYKELIDVETFWTNLIR